ncbi:hypothetical protein [Companilactobacillus furfuricola]|uniref:hypothetical protein n=1 Tax=Companilactobacillus furfuricola TaxID=1462575 RepID=UPI000F7A5A16|nr:hypothetical protein [Companilactobacillus furfuricola]
MVSSKYFSLEKYDQQNINRMSFFSALAFGLTHAVILRKSDFAKMHHFINGDPVHVFDGILRPDEITPELINMGRQLAGQIRTVPFTAISEESPPESRDFVVSFNSTSAFFNFTTALQTLVKEQRNSRHFAVNTNWVLEQAQGVPRQYEGPAKATIFDINTNSSLGCYKFNGIGTNSFYMEDPKIAMKVIDDLYEIQCREFRERALVLNIDPNKLLKFTPIIQKIKVTTRPIQSEIIFENESYLLKPQTIHADEPEASFFI